MSTLFNSKFFQAGVWLLLVFLIILVGKQVSFVFQPFIVMFNTLFFPFLAAGFLYFLLEPLVGRLQQYRIPRWASILVLYLTGIGLMFFLGATAGSALRQEVERLIKDGPRTLERLQGVVISLQENPWVRLVLEEEPQYIERIAEQLTNFLDRVISGAIGGIGSLFGSAADIFVVIFVIPFILFYMLRDGQRWPEAFLRHVPERHRQDATKVLREIKRTISSYIQGIILVCVSVGVLVYIGYLIVGVDYPLLLAVFSMITNVIPFLGPIIGSIPAIIVGIIHSPLMALKVIMVIIVVQQVESLLISPQVMGKKLAIGPLTVLLLVLVAGKMAGLVGMILALPAFMIVKTVANHLYAFIRVSRE